MHVYSPFLDLRYPIFIQITDWIDLGGLTSTVSIIWCTPVCVFMYVCMYLAVDIDTFAKYYVCYSAANKLSEFWVLSSPWFCPWGIPTTLTTWLSEICCCRDHAVSIQDFFKYLPHLRSTAPGLGRQAYLAEVDTSGQRVKDFNRLCFYVTI